MVFRRHHRAAFAAAERLKGIVGLLGFRADHANARDSALGRERGAADESAAAHGRADDIERRNLRQQLERRGALPRDDSLVIERMNELARLGGKNLREPLLARRQSGLAQFHARARRFDGRDFRARGIPGDDDDGAHAARPRRQRQRIAVIARGVRDHERRARRIELQQHVHGAAIFERAAGLQVFALEEHLRADARIERRANA